MLRSFYSLLGVSLVAPARLAGNNIDFLLPFGSFIALNIEFTTSLSVGADFLLPFGSFCEK